MEYEYLYTECVWVENLENLEDPGGGYIPPDPEPDTCMCLICPICGGCLTAANSSDCPSPCPGHDPQAYVSQTGDVLCNPNLSSTMSPQFPNTCVTSIMEYINNSFCGGSTSQGVYETDYAYTYNAIVLLVGVDPDDIPGFVGRHFYTTSFSGFQDAIDNGRIVID